MRVPDKDQSLAGSRVRLERITKSFGSAKAVDDVSLNVPAGAFVSLLGPSGSGKTTTLNLIAGFLTPDSGEIFFDETAISNVPSHKRDIGMVFQSYALFPHMTAAENIAFPLRMRARMSRQDSAERVTEMVDLMRLSGLEARYPPQLSGGQQQRVAMARALVSRPRLLLMDEPLGALDKKLREQMQFEIKGIHRTVGTTFVYVTHDQLEALTMSDLVVVMNDAKIAQVGTPTELYESPNNIFVADFLGDSNLLAVEVIEATGNQVVVRDAPGTTFRAVMRQFRPQAGSRAAMLVRPEHISVSVGDTCTSSDNSLSGIVGDISYNGDCCRLSVVADKQPLRIKIPATGPLAVQSGQHITMHWDKAAARILPPGSARLEPLD